jgi:uncharacterized membrane protein YccC
MTKLPPPLITRADLRMALTAGLSAGLLICLGLPDPIYGPMAVGSVLGGTLGASRTLGIQRMQGTVLGGVIVLVGIPTMGSIVPLPIAIAVSLACTRLFGGALGLHSGYKVAGLVVTVGWTIHQAEIFTWLPARLIDTLIGVLLSWLAVAYFWPSRAINQRDLLSKALFVSFASAFRERAGLLGRGADIDAANRRDQRDQLLAKILALQNNRVDARTELESDALGVRLGRLWDLQEQLLSELIAVYRTLLRLPMVPMDSPSLQDLLTAEIGALRASADCLDHWSSHWPEAAKGNGNGADQPSREAVQAAAHGLEQAEAAVFDDPEANRILMLASGGRRAVACQQLLITIQSFDAAWKAVP